MLEILQPAPQGPTDRRIYARIGRFLAEHGLPPNPANYSLVYQMMVESDSTLSREIEKAVSDGVRLTQAEADRIRDAFGIAGAAAGSVEPIDDSTLATARVLIEQFAATVATARAETASYGRDLEEGAAALRAETREAGLDGLIRLTSAILERTRAAEARLISAERETCALRKQLSEVEAEARQDPLTRLANRRAFEDRRRELDASGVPVAIAICDLDQFKLINDAHGHAVGDRVLRMMARRLETCCAGHMVARLGGEEFVILFENMTPRAAAERVEEARRALARTEFIVRATNARIGRITFSAGIAASAEGTSDALERADALLYEAKKSGRNQVRFEDAE